MLVCTFALVSRVLGQSHVDLGLELIAQVTVLETGPKCQYAFSTFIIITQRSAPEDAGKCHMCQIIGKTT